MAKRTTRPNKTADLSTFTEGTAGIVPKSTVGDTAAGKFLKPDGTWGVPATPSPTITTLESGSLTGTDVDLVEDSAGLWATYRELILYIDNGSVAAGSVSTSITISINSGSTFITTGYLGLQINEAASVTFLTTVFANCRTITAAARGTSAAIRITGHQGGTNPVAQWVSTRDTGATDGNMGMVWYQAGTSAVNALRITASGSTYDSGTYKLIGIK